MTPTDMDPITAMDTAVTVGYVTTRSVKDRASTAWHRHCRDQHRPFIWVRRYIHNAEIVLDLDPIGRQLTAVEERWVGRLLTEHGIRASYGRTGLRSSRMPADQIECFAGALAGLLRYTGAR